MLPFDAFRKFASDGKILVALDGGSVAGYLLFRVRKRTGVAVIVHLCVEAAQRGNGASRLLVQTLATMHPYAPGIAARCREDYPAHNVWPRLGFDRISDRPGRSKKRLSIIDWWRPIADRSLLTYAINEEALPAAALDTNVFRDIVEPREAFLESIALEADWLSDVVELVATGQLESEIHEASRSVPSLKGTVSRFRRLAPSPDDWQPIAQQLTALLLDSDVDNGDIRHIAQASAGDARFFVTRDGPVLETAELIEATTGLQIIRPAELLLRLHADQFESAYRAQSLLETNLRIEHPTTLPSKTALVEFTDHTSNEKSGELWGRLNHVATKASSGGRIWNISRDDGLTIALAATVLRDNALRVELLRVRSGLDRLTFARQLLHHFREVAVASGVPRVDFVDCAPTYVLAALVAEGYRAHAGGWVANCPTTISVETAKLLELDIDFATPSPYQVSRVERWLWPAKLITGSVPSYIVPVQAHWAHALFGNEHDQPHLFTRPEGLGLAREHVYYRSLTHTLQTPARLLWYVTGGGLNSGMRATSWLDDVVHERPRTLYRRYGTQGIYTREDVEKTARAPGALVTAMVFSRTETFEHHIPLALAKQIYPPIGTNQFLRTTRRVNEHVFAAFRSRGSAHP